MSEELSRVEDLLENGVEEPVLPMSELEAILRGEKVKPHSRVAELLLQYNPQDILIEKRIDENGTYYASVDNADGYFKVIVDTPVVPPTVLDHLVDTITQNGEYTYTPEHDGYSDAEIKVNVPRPQPVVASKTVTENDTYVAADEQLDGYSQVVVNVPPTPMDTMNITHNGTYRPPTGRGFNEVNVTVPLGSKSITSNGTYTATDDNLDGYSSVAVDVPQIGIKDIPNTPTPIASFNDGTANPLKSLTASIEPVQDLHGYDSPWAGGAGKNLFNMGSKLSGTASGLTFTTDDNYININGTKNGGTYVTPTQLYFDLPAGTYYAKVFVISGTTSNAPSVHVYSNQELTSNMLNTERSFTIESQTSVGIRFAFWNDGATFNNYKLGIVISKTSNIDKFYPYSNICPISGWTEEVVTRTGKNLLPMNRGYNFPYNPNVGDTMDVTTATAGWTDDGNGDFSCTIANWERNGLLAPIPKNQTISMSIYIKGGAPRLTTVFLDKDFKVVDKWGNANPSGIGEYRLTTTQSEKVCYVGICVIGSDGNKITISNPTIQLGNTAIDYEPYAGTTTTIPFTDAQGNPVEVYGGSVDVVNGGEQPRTLGYVDLGSLTWNVASTGEGGYTFFWCDAIPDKAQNWNFMCSQYKNLHHIRTQLGDLEVGVYNSNNLTSSRRICIRDDRYAEYTVEQFKTAMSGVQLVYELYEPTTFYTQPTSIKSLVGENNVSASTGEILSGKYFGYVYPELGTKTITENGTYTATDDNLDGYSEVTINVAGGGGETKYYEYIRALDGQVIVRVEYPDAERTYATKTLWFFNGYYTDGGDKPIPDNLWPYLPWGYSSEVLMTSGYSDSTSEMQIGWVGFLYPNYRDPSYTKIRTWTENKGSTMAGTFWGVLDISGEVTQTREWFDPYENVPPSQIRNYGGTIIDGYNLNTNLKALGIVLKDSAMSYEIDNDSFDITWNESGAYIGFNFSGDVDLKASDIQRLSYKIDFGTCYDNANNQNIRPFIIGVTDTIRTTPSTGVYFDPSQVDNYFTKYKMYYKDVCNTTVEDYVDISDIEGPCYLFIVATGWIASITDLSMVSNSTPQIGTTLSQFNFFNYMNENSNSNKINPIDTETFDVYWSGAVYIGHCLTANIPLSGKKRLDIDMDYIGENYQHSSSTHTRNHNLAIVVTDTKVSGYVNLDNLERDNHILVIKEWDGNDIYGQSIHTSIDLSNISGEYYINYQLPGYNIDGFKARLYPSL